MGTQAHRWKALADRRRLAEDRRMTEAGQIGWAEFEGIGIALGLGLLIGLQRGWKLRALAQGSRFAGIRTFALMGLAGGIAGNLYADMRGPATVLLAGAATLVVAGYYRASRIDGLADGTSGFAALVTLACGLLAGSGQFLLATVIAVAMLVLLVLREQLHALLNKLSEEEVRAIARFAVIALVILPLLPSVQLGPYSAWNPRLLWTMVVLVSGFSFAGYFAARLLGAERGVLATAAAGSMVSSTAVTATLATRLRTGEGEPAVLAGAVSVASVVMIARVLVLVAAIAPFALGELATLTLPAALVSVAAAAWFLRTARHETASGQAALELRNPFDLKWALLLTAMVMVLAVIVRWALATWGDQGLALVLAISGTADVDSAIITLGGLPAGTLDARTAALVLSVSVILNTLFKGAVALTIAGWRNGWRSALPLFATAAACAAAFGIVATA
jgi:uncharacterized membrane protein (DUF4010 family)